MGTATRNGTGRGMEHGSVNAWIEGARVLSEEGRLAWMLGQGLQEALGAILGGAESPKDAAAVATRLGTWVKTALRAPDELRAPAMAAGRPSRRPADETQTRGVRLARERAKPVAKGAAPEFSWSQASTRRLDERGYPVLFVGARRIRGAWASLALGVDLNGNKHVLGGRDDAEAAMLLADLAGRGLAAEDGLLVITDGSRRLDEAVGHTWRGRAQVQHCLYRLRHDLRAHAPAEEHSRIERVLEVAGTHPAGEARVALEELWERWRGHHPGAAARLERSLDAALTVARLGVMSGRLREHLQIQGMLRVACEQAVREGNPSASGLEALASGLGAWLERTRRFIAREQLPALAERLRQASQENGCLDTKRT